MDQPLRWESRFESGHAALDFKHQVLFALMNEVQCAVADGGTTLTPREMLAGFARYARGHFAEEEELMEFGRYPGLEAHRAAHAALCEEIVRMSAPDATIEVADVCAFAREWLVDHIIGTDLPMIDFLRRDPAA